MRSVFILALTLASISLSAQRYTYFGGGLALNTSRFQILERHMLAHSGPILSGGYYDVYFRQNISKYLSVELGINAGGNSQLIEFKTGHTLDTWYFGGMHTVPLNMEIETDVFSDRISVYGSCGTVLIYIHDTNGSGSAHYPDDFIVNIDWDQIEKGRFSLLYSLGFGSRYRLVDELYFDLELKYVMGFNVLRSYHFSYEDHAGNLVTENLDVRGSHWQFKFGFSYPIQRVADGYRKAKKSIEESGVFY